MSQILDRTPDQRIIDSLERGDAPNLEQAGKQE
jgi:hypothetical protein